jgi:hypothetical protein
MAARRYDDEMTQFRATRQRDAFAMTALASVRENTAAVIVHHPSAGREPIRQNP